MASYCASFVSEPPRCTVAGRERQSRAVSRLPLEKETDGVEEFRMMRPYDRCFMVLFSGLTAMWRPIFALVLRKTILSMRACSCVDIPAPFYFQTAPVYRRRANSLKNDTKELQIACCV